MNKTKTIIALMSGIAVSFGASAFAADEVDVKYTYSTPSDGPGEDEVEQHEFRADFKLPFENDLGITFGGSFQANIWSLDSGDRDDFDVYKLRLPIGYAFQATENIPVVVGLVPGIHSDFEDVDGDDFAIHADAVGSYAQSAALTWVFGVGFGEEFGDATAYPIGGAIWQATDSITARLVFPNPNITYSVSDALNLFIAGEPTGGEWNVGEDDDSFDLQQTGYRVGLGGEYQISDGGWLYIMAGVESERELQVAKDEEELFDDEIELDDNAFVQIGFRIK